MRISNPWGLLSPAILVLLLTAPFSIGGCSFLPEKVPRPGMTAIYANPPDTKVKVALYFPDRGWQYLVREDRETVRKGEPVYLTALRELMAGPAGSNAVAPLSPGATLVAEPVLSRGTLFLSFSSDIMRLQESGRTERIVLESLVYTLTDIKEVTAVQVLIDGRRLDTLGGTVNISRPLTRAQFSPQIK